MWKDNIMSLSEFLAAVLVLIPAPQTAPNHYSELQQGMLTGESALFLRLQTFVSFLLRSIKVSQGWKWYRTPFKLPPTPRRTGERLRRTRRYNFIWMKTTELDREVQTPLHTRPATAWTGSDCRIVCFEKLQKLLDAELHNTDIYGLWLLYIIIHKKYPSNRSIYVVHHNKMR